MLNKVLVFGLFLSIVCGVVVPFEAVASEEDKESESDKIVALSEVAPELYYQLRRYNKFYGDPNTNTDDFADRTQLFGDLGGVRDTMVEKGFYVDISLTQFAQNNFSGGADDGTFRFNGTADYWVTFDSGKAGLWPGGAVFMHAESSWAAHDSVNADTGALIPANFDAAMPTPNKSRALVIPELYVVQALSEEWIMMLGKANWAGLGDTNAFANNERTQFSNTALVNNPLLGTVVSYTTLGSAFVWTPNAHHQVSLLAVGATGDASTTGFGDLEDGITYGVQYQFTTKLGDLPGNYRILAGYSTKKVTRLDVDQRTFLEELLGIIPVEKKNENYLTIANFDQYIWVRDPAEKPASGKKPVGVGIFARAGWGPGDRNAISQFYSLGIGGQGAIFAERDDDMWGLGWHLSKLSDSLRDNVGSGIVRDNEYGVEAFYNFALTPAIGLTFNMQAIKPMVKLYDTAYVGGTRLQLDF